MTVRVGINGFGRRGRTNLRAALDRAEAGTEDVEVVAFNDIAPPAPLAHLPEYESTFGPIGREVSHDDNSVTVDGRRIAVSAERDPAALHWSDYGADVVIESTGRFRDRDAAALHLKGGAHAVLDGIAVRVPVEDGSLTDLSVVLRTAATAEEINTAFADASEGPLNGILRVSRAPIVSRDVIGDPASCVFDLALTQANGSLVKVFDWYDNEWGYTNRLLGLTALVADA
ncbi:glyceraldehyde 3-phosphate dehydrogenase NAD-binding domain-containing protein [Streptomyces sp. NBC_01176]|uniref:glyceraldehyde 3-phosphate dehydrogenase NAD-binding domain-containing protein n=1 Tax=Streptomyces sp. NBC_01176 TaxID=2903760 RepID=UPI00386AB723|nr:hypothetical protein OG199_41005 [Streptomyces sp. NBC_01176]